MMCVLLACQVAEWVPPPCGGVRTVPYIIIWNLLIFFFAVRHWHQVYNIYPEYMSPGQSQYHLFPTQWTRDLSTWLYC